jgi:hypothetical protein
MDSRLLGLEPRGLLLGSRRVVRSSLLRRSLDPRVLGLLWQPLGLPSRLLGQVRRFLRRHQLRLRLHRDRLLWWLLAWK